MKNKIVSFIDNKFSDRFIGIGGISLLIIYYFVGLLSYITTPIKSFYKYFTADSAIAIVLRAFLCGLVCLYCIIVIIKYRLKIKWNWLIIFVFILFMTLISILISPLTYKYIYVESLYKLVHIIEVSPGVPRTIVMYLSSIADFAFGFCIIFILPFVINKPKKLLYLLIPIVVICLFECAYSAIKEKDIYLYLLNHPDDPFGGYGHEAGATFGNKQDWGAFLTVSFASAVVSIYLLPKNKLGLFLKIGLILCCILFFGFSVMSLCKTSILGIGLCILLLLFGFYALCLKKSKKFIIFVTIAYTVFFISIITMFATDGFGIEILGKVCKYFKNFIVGRTEDSIVGRTSLWLNYMQNVRGYNLFFGMGKAGVFAYTKALAQEGQAGIHNGFANFFASYGLIGFMVLVFLMIMVVKNIIKLYKESLFLTFMLLGIFASCLIFILAESEVLIISTSNPVFIFNVLLVIFPSAVLINKRRVLE